MQKITNKNRFQNNFLVALIIASITFAISYFNTLQPVEYILYDRLLRLQSNEENKDVVIIAIDEKSLQHYGPLPWPRSIHSKLLTQINKVEVKAIGYDVLFNKPLNEDDKGLVKAVKDNGKVVFPVVIEKVSQRRELLELTPFPELYQAANNLGLVHFELGEDNIARSAFLRAGLGEPFWRVFSAEVLDVANGDEDYHLPYKDNVANEIIEPYPDLSKIVKEQLVYIPYKQSSLHYKRISFVDIAENNNFLTQLTNKVLFVGVTASAARNADFLPVPVDRDGQIMPGVEINATLYDALKNKTTIRKVPDYISAIFSSVLVFLFFYLLPKSLPRRNFYYLITGAVSVIAFCWWQLHFIHLWWPLLTPLLVILLGYLFWIWRKVVINMSFFKSTIERLKIETENAINVGKSADLKTRVKFLSRLDLIETDFLDLIDDQSEEIVQYIQAKEYSQYEKKDLSEKDKALLHKTLTSFTAKQYLTKEKKYGVIEDRIKKVETAIAQINLLRRFIEQTMERMSDGIIMSDTTGRIFYSNLLAKSIIPALRDTKKTDLLSILSGLKLDNNLNWKKILKSILSDSIGQDVQALSDMGLDLKVNVSLLNNVSGRNFIILNIVDITAIKREQRRQLEMVDFISHDLRSPLTSILAMLSRYKRKPESFDSVTLTKEVERLTRSSLNLAEHFLMLSRAESHADISLYPIELLNTIDNAMAIVMPQVNEKRLTINFDFSLYDDIWINANQDLLERVITNLLSNAVKYSSESTKIDIDIVQSKKYLQIKVIDRGEGIEQAQMDAIFKPFTRMQKHEMASVKGIGLGLRFVRAAMLRFGGTVDVTSTVGVGSCFTLEFPASSIIKEL